MVYVVLTLWHQDNMSSFDRPSRFVAAAIILTMLLRVPVTARAVFAGGAAIGGAIASGVFAVYEVFVSGVARVSSFDNAIYFGNGALILALVSLTGLFAELPKPGRRRSLLLFYGLGSVGGVAALLLSGTRGGWLALPVIALVGLWAYRGVLIRRPRLLALALVIIATLGGVVAGNMKIVSDRVDVAMSEARSYFTENRVGTPSG